MNGLFKRDFWESYDTKNPSATWAGGVRVETLSIYL
jgi:hypothetical protein